MQFDQEMVREQEMVDSRYAVVGVLGRGGYAAVYEAIDRRTNQRVALKVATTRQMADVAAERLTREARTTDAIRHPNICAVVDQGVLDDGRPFVAMELFRGETLRDYLTRRGRIEIEEAIEIAVQVLAGLEAAHGLGVIHRDVKPDNVFLVRDGSDSVIGRGRPVVKLLDFGACRSVGLPVDETLTLTGLVIGTPGYLAPEQAYGERNLDGRADLFAVGLILFEMLTGQPAYVGRTPAELVQSVTRAVPPVRRYREVPTLLDRIVAHATELDARVRYESAGAFMHDLLTARTVIRTEGSHSVEARRRASCAAADSNAWDVPTRRFDLSGGGAANAGG